MPGHDGVGSTGDGAVGESILLALGMTLPLGSGDQTDGHLLGGRVRYIQPRQGFRSGIEPVLLAAAITAREGDRVLEGGSGAGAALLCLAARIPGLRGVGIELDPALALLASRNASANDHSGLEFIAADIALPPVQGVFDHAFANPPYHAAGSTPSPDVSRRVAKQGDPDLLATWAAALAVSLRPRGTLTFILPAALLPQAMEAFATAGCQPAAALPLWPKAGVAAKLILLRGTKGGRAPFRLSPGLVLHRPDGAFTNEAEAILRDAQPLPL
jgi:tRNA1Val (adenine37-N6)-methyltransferase